MTKHLSPPAGLSRSDDPRINADPPAASGTPLQGQHETNRSQFPVETNAEENANLPEQPEQHPAYQFGWQSYLQYGRSPSTTAPSFEALEPELARNWEERQKSTKERQPWAAAREMARDAWNKVHDAMSGE
jgi:hypothetical protein